ncbi:DUF2927 domain-containing protein [Dyadobacter arcticus]|uniref:DUF2927 domain-containing protein n=1 Tax=Dyadobacter arcticus TaxID=1078754 RepID=A0ABX0UJ00_9BACT|nr:DUF2927 domain-containing protein [Dyadobacter arcticus]NIJ52983.1 hypothetical protein [Dyadobacter arcticus]
MPEKIRIIFLIFMTCAMATLFSACGKKKGPEINADEILGLKGRYDMATINYFYETVFHEDFESKNLDNLLKWNSDPKIVLVGNPSETEIGYVKNVIARINKLDLPIKCTLEIKSDANSIEIFFGNVKEVGAYLKADSLIQNDVDTTSHFGMARSVSYDGILSKAYVGIYYNGNDTLHSTRENIVLEEIVQSLGVTGDSYTYPGSLFFQNDNPDKSFTRLDMAVVSMLYDPAIPLNYPRESFEKDFSDELYSINTSEKIKKLLGRFPEDLYTSGDLEACFTGQELLKHPREIWVNLCGSVQNEDSVIVERAIASIHKIVPDLHVRLAPKNVSERDYGIVLNLKHMDQQKEAIHRNIEVVKGDDCMFPKLIKSRVSLSFNGSEKSKKFRQQSIVDALYFSLVPIPQNRLGGNKLFEIGDNTVEFNKRYADLLRLIYSNEFVDGLKLGDFKNIKSTLTK